MRLFSVPRRRPNLVDLMAVFNPNAEIYRVKWGANFDTTPLTTIINSPNIGYYDDNIPRGTVEVQGVGGRLVRIVFDPATFSIPDDKPFWLTLAQVVGGAETAVSPPTLILPESAHHGVGVVVLAGSAPNGVSVANSLQIDLPRLMSDIRIVNKEGTGGHTLYVATTPGGPETAVLPLIDGGQTTLTLLGTESTLLVRGGGGAVAFSATLTAAFPK